MSDLAKSALSMANELHSRDVMRNGCRENCILKQSPEWRAADFLVMAAEHFATLEAKLATCKKYRDAYAECDRIATQAVRDLEAKLAKAVAGRDEALNQLDSARQSVDVLEKRVANLLCGYDEHRKPFVTSRTTLAELKGEDE